MKGLKWRAYSPATSKIAELVGAQPVTVQAAEVSQALATGVDRFVHVVGRHRLRLQDLRAHQELVRHAGVAAEERGDRQPARRSTRSTSRRRRALLKAAADAETRGWKLSEEKNGWYLDQLKAEGHDASIKPSEQLTADLRRVGNYMLAEWQKKAGDDGKKVIDAYRDQQ